MRYFAALGLALVVVGAVVGMVAVCVARIGLLELGSVGTLGLIFLDFKCWYWIVYGGVGLWCGF